MGEKRKVKAGAAGGKAGKPPSGFRKGIVIRRPPGQAPRRVPQWQGQPVPLPVQPRGCKGRSPRQNQLKISPFPGGEGGGGWGKKRKVKAGAAGGKAGKPPSGFRKGIVIRRPPGQTPRRVPQWQGQPVPPGFSPGDARGEAPCIRKPKNLPLPRRGRGVGGDGGEKAMIRQAKQARQDTATPPGKRGGRVSRCRLPSPPLNAPVCGA